MIDDHYDYRFSKKSLSLQLISHLISRYISTLDRIWSPIISVLL